MIDPQELLEQVLGASAARDVTEKGTELKGRLDSLSGSQGFAGGALAGGVLGLLLGGKRPGGLAGGLLRIGGAAVLGALALKAYRSYQEQQGASATGAAAASGAAPHRQPAADGGPFELVLVQAMIGAAKADGHIDAAEQRRLFAEVERLGLDPESKAYVLDLLTRDVDLDALAGAVRTPEQGAELYLAARLAIDPDEPAERQYLDALAVRLALPAALRLSLDSAPR